MNRQTSPVFLLLKTLIWLSFKNSAFPNFSESRFATVRKVFWLLIKQRYPLKSRLNIFLVAFSTHFLHYFVLLVLLSPPCSEKNCEDKTAS